MCILFDVLYIINIPIIFKGTDEKLMEAIRHVKIGNTHVKTLFAFYIRCNSISNVGIYWRQMLLPNSFEYEKNIY